ncbi:MAG: efflux RND transporter periplasmic adaptor subunit, partial [Bacteroidota bacterium]
QSLDNVESSKAQIENAKAQLESARANYIASKSNYERFEKLYETNSISLSDFEQAKSAYSSAEATFRAAETQVQAAQASKASTDGMAKSASNQINYTRLSAPYEGVITNIVVEQNEMVGQGSPIMVINSINNPDVEIGIPENAIAEIKPSQSVKVQFNSIHDKEFNGEVYEIGYSSAGSTYPVTIRLKESDDRIRPGMPASATFSFLDHHDADNAILVPPSAVGEDGNGNFVYKVIANNEHYICKKQSVEVGELNDAGFEILSGLSDGDKVATAGLNVLSDGLEVSLYEQN